MTEKEKIGMLEEILDVEEGTLETKTCLLDLEEWDSVTALSFVAMMDDTFHKEVTGEQMNQIKTVSDALAMMHEG